MLSDAYLKPLRRFVPMTLNHVTCGGPSQPLRTPETNNAARSGSEPFK